MIKSSVACKFYIKRNTKTWFTKIKYVNANNWFLNSFNFQKMLRQYPHTYIHTHIYAWFRQKCISEQPQFKYKKQNI